MAKVVKAEMCRDLPKGRQDQRRRSGHQGSEQCRRSAFGTRAEQGTPRQHTGWYSNSRHGNTRQHRVNDPYSELVPRAASSFRSMPDGEHQRNTDGAEGGIGERPRQDGPFATSRSVAGPSAPAVGMLRDVCVQNLRRSADPSSRSLTVAMSARHMSSTARPTAIASSSASFPLSSSSATAELVAHRSATGLFGSKLGSTQLSEHADSEPLEGRAPGAGRYRNAALAPVGVSSFGSNRQSRPSRRRPSQSVSRTRSVNVIEHQTSQRHRSAAPRHRRRHVMCRCASTPFDRLDESSPMVPGCTPKAGV